MFTIILITMCRICTYVQALAAARLTELKEALHNQLDIMKKIQLMQVRLQQVTVWLRVSDTFEDFPFSAASTMIEFASC